jgi:hypothetical protein
MKTISGIHLPGQIINIKVLILSCLVFLISCTNIYFENPQPAGQENLREFPKKLLGTYVDSEKGDTVVTVLPDGISLSLNGNDVKIPLSEKTILRNYKSFYFLNLKQEEDSLWTVYIVKPAKKKTLDLYDFSTEQAQLEKLSAITEVKKKIKEGQDSPLLTINPDIAGMDQILESGLLKPTQKLQRK